MDYSRRISHARGVLPPHGTQHMGTVRVKQVDKTDTKIIARELLFK